RGGDRTSANLRYFRFPFQGWRGGHRQINGEYAALPTDIAHGQFAAIRFHTATTDREPQAKARSLRVQLLEWSKHLLRFSVRESTTLVLDLDQNTTTRCIRPQPDATWGAG